MKKTIYTSNYQEISKLDNENFFFIFWRNTADLTDEEYRAEILQQLNAYQTYQVRGSLIDTSDFEFTIIPATQQWANNTIFPPAAEAGLRYVALMVAKDFYARLSIQQYTDEHQDNLLEFKYFHSVSQAREWLQKETSKTP